MDILFDKQKYPLLSRVEEPSDLKELDIEELHLLCDELRKYIIEVVSENGGHLAPNLGVVELTVALHYVLDSPKDKIVWDVSHQSYAHKILTGRKHLFSTLRMLGGVSGFTNRNESKHDVYTTGHASTSLAFAMGLARARDKKGTDETIAVVIGDGSLTGGVAFEALNNLGHRKTQLITILNDNEMSIARNVGALSSYLSRVRLDPAYNRFREEAERFIKRLPAIGETVKTISDTLKEGLKALIVPGMLFEELGIRYFGPFDGHNLERLIKAINWTKTLREPVVIHIITKKGKGYLPAEEHPEKFHGSSPFEVETGEPKKKSNIPSYTEVFGNCLVKLAESDDKIVGITAAMSSGTGLNIFASKYPDRFYDVGISEQFAVSFAAGLSANGYKPVCAIYSTFLSRAYDQLIYDVCLQDLPVVFAIDRGGLVGEDGPTHHGVYDLSYLRPIPNIIIAAPSDEVELSNLLFSSMKWGKPAAIRYPRGTGTGIQIPEEFEFIKPGNGRFLKHGKTVAFIAIGKPVVSAIKAAKELNKRGISPTVFDARFAKPLDEESILKIAKTHKYILTIEDNAIAGGVGEAIESFLSSQKIRPSIVHLGISDEFITQGTPDELYELVGLDENSIVDATILMINNRELTNRQYVRKSH